MGGWGLGYQDNTDLGSNALFNYDYLRSITFGADDTRWADGILLLPEDAFNIDTKLDDGKPASGRVHGLDITNCTNASSNTDRAAIYLLTRTTAGCSLGFLDAAK